MLPIEPDSNWKALYRMGAIAAVVVAALIPVQIAIFVVFPPPATAIEFFTLFERNRLLGLLSLDLLYLVDNTLVIPLYLALYIALRRYSQSAMLVAEALIFVGLAAYFSSNTAFEMLSLSGQYAAATSEAQRIALVGAGEAMLALYEGTAFDVYYVFGGVAVVIISFVMLRSDVFGKSVAILGIMAGALMIVPSTAGTIGLYLALLSLVPTAGWLILMARRLFWLATGSSPT